MTYIHENMKKLEKLKTDPPLLAFKSVREVFVVDLSKLSILPFTLFSFNAASKNIKLDIIRPTGELVKTLLEGVERDGSQTIILDPETLQLAPGCYIVRLIDAYSVKHVSFCYLK